MNRRSSLALAVVFAVLLTAHSAAMAQGLSFRPFDFPSATGTFAFGINDLGDVAGYYVDAQGVPHGFVRWAATETFTEYNVVGASGTFALGINDEGQIVGACFGGPCIDRVFGVIGDQFTGGSIPARLTAAAWTFRLSQLFTVLGL